MKILFLCRSDASLARMAEAVFNALFQGEEIAVGAGVRAAHAHPAAIEVMREIGIDISDSEITAAGDLRQLNFDMVVTLRNEVQKRKTPLPESETLNELNRPSLDDAFASAAIQIHWTLGELSDEHKDDPHSLAAYRKVRDEMEKRIRILLDHEYYGAMKEQRRRFNHLADLMDDGLIAHDDLRNIFLFNRKAEQITGLSRTEVCGRDCHDIFPPSGICGAQCRFKDSPSASTQKQQYEVVITDTKGIDKRLKMSSAPFVVKQGVPTGVLAILRDMSEIMNLKLAIGAEQEFHGMIGVSNDMRKVFDTIKTVAPSAYPILISGESGVGKELVARAIHAESRRFAGPFVPVNCGALPENILESELFGHVRGAFTGAIREKKGRFELADGGTLFLDEVGELPASFQVKLLRVLQEQSFERVGGEKPIKVDVRILSATNRDLKQMIAKGRFRDDLYYRLCVVPICLPPLRERPDGLALLVNYLLEEINRDADGKRLGISAEAMNLLLRYDWPGNIRELKNALQFASIHCTHGQILPEHLPPEIRLKTPELRQGEERPLLPGRREFRKKKLNRDSLLDALEKTRGNKLQAAKILGVGRATLYRFLKEHPDIFSE